MSPAKLDETEVPSLKFDASGLIPVIVSDERDHAVLMFAWMNREALQMTLSTGLLHFYSRSRRSLWKKGESSGEMFRLKHMLVDCDQDVLLAQVEPLAAGKACHTGRRSCFYRELDGDRLRFVSE